MKIQNAVLIIFGFTMWGLIPIAVIILKALE